MQVSFGDFSKKALLFWKKEAKNFLIYLWLYADQSGGL
jgi:hypothetical protein